MPKKDDPPADPSDPALSGADPTTDGSPAAPETEGSKKTETLEKMAMRRVQSMIDRDVALLEQGRTNEMNPKVIELLTRYDELTSGNSQEEAPRGGYYPSQQPQRSNSPQPTKFEELGRQAARDQLIAGVRNEVETDLVTELWAEDIRALFNELGDSPITPEEFATIDFQDKRRFPNTRAGYQVWRQAASTFRQERAADTSDGDAGTEGENAAINADRAKANAKPGQPNPTPVGAAAVDVLRAAQLNKEGKMESKAFMEIVRRNVTPGIMTHS